MNRIYVTKFAINNLMWETWLLQKNKNIYYRQFGEVWKKNSIKGITVLLI